MLNFIVNPNAAGKKGYACWKKLERSLLKKKTEYRIFLTGEIGDARKFSRSLTEMPKDKGRILIVVGGEGTFNEVLDGANLSNSPIFGFISAGGKSELLRALGLPKNPLSCLNHILSRGTIRWVEYGVLSYGDQMPHHCRFIVHSGAGLEALLMEKGREETKKNAFFTPVLQKAEQKFAALCVAKCFRPVKSHLILDGERKFEYPHLILLNVNVIQGNRGKDTKTEPGYLSVNLFHTRSATTLIRSVFMPSGYFSGKNPACRMYACRELKVILDDEMPLHADGESCGRQKQFTVRISERKLRFLC